MRIRPSALVALGLLLAVACSSADAVVDGGDATPRLDASSETSAGDASSADATAADAAVDASREATPDATSDATADATPPDAASCQDGDRTTQACGACGTQQGFCVQGQWIFQACMGETGTCVPGATRPSSCGMCGTTTETCSNTCQWHAGTCSGQGTCWAGQGDVTTNGCPIGEQMTRICSTTCTWSAWSTCAALVHGWQPISQAPIGPRTSATVAWSGREVLVWGGSGPPNGYLADGAAYTPATNTWRILPASPLRGRYDAAGVWTGSAFLVWGGFGLLTSPADGGPPVTPDAFADGAAFDPSMQTWTNLPTSGAPAARRAASFVWATTTAELIVWGGIGAQNALLTDGAAYKPSTATWRAIAPTPLGSRWNQTAVWSGTKMVIFGGYYSSGMLTLTRGDAAEYDPVTDAWTTIDTSTSGLGARGVLGATASPAGRATFYGGQDNNAFFDTGASWDSAARAWTPLRAPRSAELGSAKRRDALLWWSSGRLWLWGGFSGRYPMDGASYDATGDAWTSFPAGFTAEHVAPQRLWTGAELFVWSGADVIGYFNDGKIYRP